MAGEVRILAVATGKEVLGAARHTGVVSWLAFSPDTSVLVSGAAASRDRDLTIEVEELDTGTIAGGK